MLNVDLSQHGHDLLCSMPLDRPDQIYCQVDSLSYRGKLEGRATGSTPDGFARSLPHVGKQCGPMGSKDLYVSTNSWCPRLSEQVCTPEATSNTLP
jgi:hypothetical protein